MTSRETYVAVLTSENGETTPVRHPYVDGKPVLEIRQYELVDGARWVETFAIGEPIDDEMWEYDSVSFGPEDGD
jgi:hypothetical protein